VDLRDEPFQVSSVHAAGVDEAKKQKKAFVRMRITP
jgi:hypothetical protein